MGDKVEVDLKRSRAIGNRPRHEAGRVRQSYVPGVIRPWSKRQANIANDLCPQMKRCIGVTPGLERQTRPGFGRYRRCHRLLFDKFDVGIVMCPPTITIISIAQGSPVV